MVLLQLKDPLELFVNRREFLPGSRFRYINVRRCGGAFATERPLGTIRKKKGIPSRFRVSISSRYDLSC